jgi:hypothetical protein
MVMEYIRTIHRYGVGGDDDDSSHREKRMSPFFQKRRFFTLTQASIKESKNRNQKTGHESYHAMQHVRILHSVRIYILKYQ